MSLKGLPKPGEESKLRDEPFATIGQDTTAKGPSAIVAAAQIATNAEETKGDSPLNAGEEKKDPILGLDSNNAN